MDHDACSSSSHDALSTSEDEWEPEPIFEIGLQLHNQLKTLFMYSEDATIQDLSDAVAEELHIPPANQKFLVSPKIGLLKPPFKDPSLSVRFIQDKKIVLIGATTAEIEELESEVAERKARIGRRRAALQAGRKVKANQSRDWKKIQDEARYTFHTLRPLPYLPHAEKSLRFLQRLRDDAGVKAVMRKHGFSVGLLTEMNPAEHTTRESRTLGLNRNRGEVIELRLRTDAYDGYRDYKVIRKTLAHELTHNVWGDHDQRFWKLCKEIEAEIEKNDWQRGGHAIGREGEEFFNPHDEGDDDEADHGGWEGGEYVLGGSNGGGGAPAVNNAGEEALSRREILARAAEERLRKQKNAQAAEQNAKDAAAKR